MVTGDRLIYEAAGELSPLVELNLDDTSFSINLPRSSYRKGQFILTPLFPSLYTYFVPV